MKSRIVYLVVLAALLAVLPASAQWTANGAPVCAADGTQQYPTIVSDGAGGAIITWHDARVGATFDIYAQRMSAAGKALWTAGGVAICTAAGDQSYPAIAADAMGGAIITWSDDRNGDGSNDIYAQRVNAAGAVQWTANGVAVCMADSVQLVPTLIVDAWGWSTITWTDGRGGNWDIYAQQLNESGAPQWAANGVAVCTAAGDQTYSTLVTDGADGAIIAWDDTRGGNSDIYARRVSAAGLPLWAANGVPVCTADSAQQYSAIVPGGAGSAIITWTDGRSGNSDIYAQRVDTSGAVQWAVNGAAVSTAAADQMASVAAADGAGGAVITWFDSRSGSWDIYAQRVNASGAALWTPNGAAVCATTGNQAFTAIAGDGAGGAVITWQDGRNANWDVYAQKLSAAGAAQWAANGIAVCTAPYSQQAPTIAADGAGGAIISWFDIRSGIYNDIYAQRVRSGGSCSNPVIKTVSDVPSDQGGKVKLEWLGVNNDVLPETLVTYYSVWRSLSGPGAKDAGGLGAAAISPATMYFGFTGPGYWLDQKDGKAYAWEWLANIPAHYFDRYSYLAATACDTVAGSRNWHHFLVSAQTNKQSLFWDSTPDSGYSVDNLPPGQVKNLAGQVSGAKGTFAAALHWNPTYDADLGRYEVHRSPVMAFTPSPATLIKTTADTAGSDTIPDGSYYYKVVAVDIHGNPGLASNVWATGALAVQVSSFSAQASGRGIKIIWRTESEQDCLRWEIERAGNGNPDYAIIGTLPGHGTSSQPVDYSFTDERGIDDGIYGYRLYQVDLSGGRTLTGSLSIHHARQAPVANAMGSARPNPFRQVTTIDYQIARPGQVTVRVYNVYGQVVRTFNEGVKRPGYYQIRWDGRNAAGEETASGMYLYRLEMPGFRQSGKVHLLR